MVLTKSSSARGSQYETHQSANRPSQIPHQQSAISNDILFVRHPTDERLRYNFEAFEAVSELIAQIERNDYMCKPQDEEEIQSWMHNLASSYAGGSEADECIARVIAGEKSIGLDDAGDEMWEALKDLTHGI